MSLKGFEPKEFLYNKEGLFYLPDEDPEHINERAFGIPFYRNEGGLNATAELSGSRLGFLRLIQERALQVPYIFDPKITEDKAIVDYFIAEGSWDIRTIPVRSFVFQEERFTSCCLYSAGIVLDLLKITRSASLIPIYLAVNACALPLIDLNFKNYEGYDNDMNPIGKFLYYNRHICIKVQDLFSILETLERPPFSDRSLLGKPKGGYSKIVAEFRKQLGFRRL